MSTLSFTRIGKTASDQVSIAIHDLVVAGWAGRDEAGIKHHIEELAAIGVPPPSQTPLYYRCSTGILTQTERLQVLGPDTSGEVEPVIVAMADGLWVGVGSDHTDRKAETYGVALSKQLCGKVIGTSLWRYDDVAGHWDDLVLRASIVSNGKREPYQEGTLAGLRSAADLIERYTAGRGLAAGTLMFGGTMSAMGGIRPADRFEMELHDPVLRRTLRHGYDIVALPVIT